MKIRSHQAPQAGNIFLLTMMVTGIFCLISMASYLSLSSSANTVVMRSLAWNTALPLAEAGIEEAFSHVTKNTANYAADNWTFNGTTYTRPSRTLDSGYYSVGIAGSPGSLLTITSTGYGQFLGGTYIPRTVQVIAQSGSTIPRAIGMVAKNGITYKGDLLLDSYDSTNALYSTNGQYDPAKRGDQARVATPLGFGLGGNSHVYGFVASGPGGAITVGGSAKVGDEAWVDGKSKGMEPGHSTNNFNTPIPDVVAPYTSAAAPASGTVSNTTYDYVLNGGNYWATNLTAGGGSTAMIVTAPSVLIVNGAISLANVVFAPGATLDLYIATPSVSFCPTIAGMTASQPVTPIQFRVWGLPTCTTMDMTGGDAFTGMIYAPEAYLQARGGANFYGSMTSSIFVCNGNFGFHYDQATYSYTPGGSSFQIISWAEM